jgi:outer membrane lipoprotein SlyB
MYFKNGMKDNFIKAATKKEILKKVLSKLKVAKDYLKPTTSGGLVKQLTPEGLTKNPIGKYLIPGMVGATEAHMAYSGLDTVRSMLKDKPYKSTNIAKQILSIDTSIDKKIEALKSITANINKESITKYIKENIGNENVLKGAAGGGILGAYLGNVLGNKTGKLGLGLLGAYLGNKEYGTTGALGGAAIGTLAGEILGGPGGTAIGGLTGAISGGLLADKYLGKSNGS